MRRNCRPGDRNAWADWSAKKRQAHADGEAGVMGGPCRVCAATDKADCEREGCPYRQAPVPPRARPVQREHHDAEALRNASDLRWWGPGLRCFDSAHTLRAGVSQRRRGYVPGWPDYGLFIPAIPVRAYLELKTLADKPARDPGAWWARCEFYFDGRGDWRIQLDRSGRAFASHHGVSGDQAHELALLDATGHLTAVCYGWEAALAQLDAWAGPRPEVMPW